MLTSRCVPYVFSLGLTILGTSSASAQDYPNKPVRIITSLVGGAGDFAARQVAEGIAPALGQQLIVDNRGSGTQPGQMVSQAPPDGYTLLVHGSNFWIGPLLQKTPYDPVRDFLPISLVSRQPNVLVVHPSLPVKTVKDLIALAKARPGELNVATGLSGGSSHLAAELFKHMSGVNIVTIPYKNNPLSFSDLMTGQVQMLFSNPSAVAAQVKAGRLRALAVTSVEPSPLVPGVPTVAASGLPGFEATQMSGIFAPAKTPDAIVNRLNQEVVRFLKTPEAKERFSNFGVEAVGSSSGELAAAVKSEIARLGKVIKDVGIKID